MPGQTRNHRSLLSATRRRALKALAALPFGAVLLRPASAALPTPSATEGPFYPEPSMRFADADNDLVKIAGAVETAGGEVIVLKGRILDRDGKPVEGARIEIWQCDVNGRYLHARDNRGPPRDKSFQGFGHVVTGPNGAYAFRTIKPVSYPGRTPHIHVKVFHGGQELTTQFYIDGHPQNADDGIFQDMSEEEQRAVSMAFRAAANGPETTIDVILGA